MGQRIGAYDSNLQMFVEAPRELNLAHLGFLRWLGENRMLEHPVAGPPPELADQPDPTTRPAAGPPAGN